MAELKHISVMFSECMQALNIESGKTYFDGTLGGGGHSYGILERSSPNGRLVATDLDDYAIGRATERLKEFEGRFTLVKDNFKNFLQVKESLGIENFDGVLLDLGVSSFQEEVFYPACLLLLPRCCKAQSVLLLIVFL